MGKWRCWGWWFGVAPRHRWGHGSVRILICSSQEEVAGSHSGASEALLRCFGNFSRSWSPFSRHKPVGSEDGGEGRRGGVGSTKNKPLSWMKIMQQIPDFISSSLLFSTPTPLICRTGDFVLFVMIGRRLRGRPVGQSSLSSSSALSYRYCPTSSPRQFFQQISSFNCQRPSAVIVHLLWLNRGSIYKIAIFELPIWHGYSRYSNFTSRTLEVKLSKNSMLVAKHKSCRQWYRGKYL